MTDITASQESNRKKDLLKKINAGNIREKEEVKCWFCSKKHKITTYEDFISSPINAKSEFVKANKFCWNCLGKDHNIKNCQSKHRCKVANCNKRHHTLLHNDNITPPPAISPLLPVQQAPQSNPNDAVDSNHFDLSKTFLQILPVSITKSTKIVHTNALLGAGSNATLIREDAAHILKLQGENKTSEIENALLNSSCVQSKIVSFSVSSSSHLEEIAIDNEFVVPNLNARYHKIDINKIR